jgi:hypothetical protein
MATAVQCSCATRIGLIELYFNDGTTFLYALGRRKIEYQDELPTRTAPTQ